MPLFTKTVNSLSISINYYEISKDSISCTITFSNNGSKNIIINPSDGNQHNQPQSPQKQPPSLYTLSESEHKPETKLFLGYLQLFGTVILNYKHDLQSRGNITFGEVQGRNTSWWVNKGYIETYGNEEEDNGEDRETLLDTVPFIEENLAHKVVIGGKLGGINDLFVEDDNEPAPKYVDTDKRYLLQDLIGGFNSYKEPMNENTETSGKLPLKLLTDSIIPFYSTSQSLIFSDLSVPQNGHKDIHVVFPKIKDGPPSYNTNLTGITGDQGLISIKYLIVLGFLQLDDHNNLVPVSIYYPLSIKGEDKGGHRWLQPDYLQNIIINKLWKAETPEPEHHSNDNNNNKNKNKNKNNNNNNTNDEAKLGFLDDLKTLIDSDLYNMPRTSTSERKKSISLREHDIHPSSTEGLIPQLPSRLKTQYNILVNNKELCRLTLSRPYYHVGDDIHFALDLNTHNQPDISNKIVGFTVHLEAHETFHVPKKPYTNVYQVSQNIKFNTMAANLVNTAIPNEQQSSSTVNGGLNIASYLCQQFQGSKLMDLKYYMVFKFILMRLGDDGQKEGEIESLQREEPQTQEQEPQTQEQEPQTQEQEPQTQTQTQTQEQEPQPQTQEQEPQTQEPQTQEPQTQEPQTQEQNPQTQSLVTSEESTTSHDDQYQFLHNYRFDNEGTEFRFRLPVVILP